MVENHFFYNYNEPESYYGIHLMKVLRKQLLVLTLFLSIHVFLDRK